MNNEQRGIPLTEIKKPRISLRPVRRTSTEYVELRESIQKDGVLQPILVRPEYCVGCPHRECLLEDCETDKSEDDFDIVEGWHRYEAAKEVGLTVIPSMIREMTNPQVLIFQLKCNAIRPTTASFEYARRLKLIMREGYTLAELSKLIDKNPTWIRNQLYLNRLCEDARGPVERGDIKMMAAVALANLPTDLQVKFIDDAIRMNQTDFVERANAARRDFQAFLLHEQQEDREIGAARPELRAVNVLKREAVKPKHAKEVLPTMNATTALQGWNAAMAWAFKLDPISVERRKQRYKEKQNEGLATREEYRQLNRAMIRKFVHHQSSTGDYRHDK